MSALEWVPGWDGSLVLWTHDGVANPSGTWRCGTSWGYSPDGLVGAQRMVEALILGRRTP